MCAVAMAEKRKEVAKLDDKNREGRNTAPIQVEKDLARMAAVIASHDGITQAKLVSPIIRQFLEVEYDRVQKQIREELNRKKQA